MKQNYYKRVPQLAVLLLASLISCQGEKEDETPIFAVEAALLSMPTEEKKATEATGSDLISVDATDAGIWVRYSLGADQILSEEGTWDLSFKRYKIATNSGTSGSGNGGACNTEETDFATAGTENIADCNFETDDFIPFPVPVAPPCADGQEEIEGACYVRDNASPVLEDWYNYDSTTHELTSRSSVYIIRGYDGNSYYKFKIIDYNSGVLRFYAEALE